MALPNTVQGQLGDRHNGGCKPATKHQVRNSYTHAYTCVHTVMNRCAAERMCWRICMRLYMVASWSVCRARTAACLGVEHSCIAPCPSTSRRPAQDWMKPRLWMVAPRGPLTLFMFRALAVAAPAFLIQKETKALWGNRPD